MSGRLHPLAHIPRTGSQDPDPGAGSGSAHPSPSANHVALLTREQKNRLQKKTRQIEIIRENIESQWDDFAHAYRQSKAEASANVDPSALQMQHVTFDEKLEEASVKVAAAMAEIDNEREKFSRTDPQFRAYLDKSILARKLQRQIAGLQETQKIVGANLASAMAHHRMTHLLHELQKVDALLSNADLPATRRDALEKDRDAKAALLKKDFACGIDAASQELQYLLVCNETTIRQFSHLSLDHSIQNAIHHLVSLKKNAAILRHEEKWTELTRLAAQVAKSYPADRPTLFSQCKQDLAMAERRIARIKQYRMREIASSETLYAKLAATTHAAQSKEQVIQQAGDWRSLILSDQISLLSSYKIPLSLIVDAAQDDARLHEFGEALDESIRTLGRITTAGYFCFKDRLDHKKSDVLQIANEDLEPALHSMMVQALAVSNELHRLKQMFGGLEVKPSSIPPCDIDDLLEKSAACAANVETQIALQLERIDSRAYLENLGESLKTIDASTAARRLDAFLAQRQTATSSASRPVSAAAADDVARSFLADLPVPSRARTQARRDRARIPSDYANQLIQIETTDGVVYGKLDASRTRFCAIDQGQQIVQTYTLVDETWQRGDPADDDVGDAEQIEDLADVSLTAPNLPRKLDSQVKRLDNFFEKRQAVFATIDRNVKRATHQQTDFDRYPLADWASFYATMSGAAVQTARQAKGLGNIVRHLAATLEQIDPAEANPAYDGHREKQKRFAATADELARLALERADGARQTSIMMLMRQPPSERGLLHLFDIGAVDKVIDGGLVHYDQLDDKREDNFARFRYVLADAGPLRGHSPWQRTYCALHLHLPTPASPLTDAIRHACHLKLVENEFIGEQSGAQAASIRQRVSKGNILPTLENATSVSDADYRSGNY